jgi:cellulose synthase/poly-beta-1,6-N-acetylglucosamine synthase-like glycosyltransferase
VTFLLALVIAPFSLLTFCLAVELFVGLKPLCAPEVPVTSGVSATIVVPAHDEAAIIGNSLRALKSETPPGSRILVVADNCSDATADIAGRLGVDVIERREPDRRGKGFALDFAKRHLAVSPPEVVVIIDADCFIDRQSIEQLVARCAGSGRPCQAVYLQTATTEASPTLQLSTFAFFIKNLIRQRAQQRLAGRAHLVGTGMALPWRLFERVGLATANIVEDLEMGLELAHAGHPALLVERASVRSDPASARDTFDQRRRWEGGFLQNAIGSGPRLLLRSLRDRDARGLWGAINIIIPPLALLLLLDFAVLVLCGLIVFLAGVAAWPLLLLGSSIGAAAAGLIAAWMSGGSRFVSLGGLARAPLYLLWKLPLYLGLARGGAPKEWLRTRRSEH